MKIFISSTYTDLFEERQVVQQVLSPPEWTSIGMELFPSEPATPLDVALSWLAQADAVVLIIGFKAGSLAPVGAGLTYTRAEFDEARRLKKRIFVFVRTKESWWNRLPFLKTRTRWRNDERDPVLKRALDHLKGDASAASTPAYWKNSLDLKNKVLQAFLAWENKGLPGARRSFAEWSEIFDLPVATERLFDYNQTLFGRKTHLQALDTFLQDDQAIIALLPGRGGIGKSKLIRDWTRQVVDWEVLFLRDQAVWGQTSTYNPRLQMTGLTAGSLLTLGYDYGSGSGTNNGNVLSQTITVGSWSATQLYPATSYDGINRLTQAIEQNSSQSVNWQQVYVYDRYGNRALLSGSQYYLPQGNQSAQVTSNDASLVEARFPGNRTDMCVFDVPGNGNAQSCQGSGNTYNYDAENRITSTGGATFAYDGDGRRVSKTVGSITTTYVYDAAGALTAEYGTPVSNPNGTVEYMTADSLGSTRLVTGTGSANGGVISRHDYIPFGQEITADMGGRSAVFGYPTTSSITADGVTHADGVTEQFTGKERDAETGLDYFGARYLSSAQGRWMSPDWSVTPEAVPYADLNNPQSLNLYAYLRNNPLATVDIDGHQMCKTCKVEYATETKVGGSAAWRNNNPGNLNYGPYAKKHGAIGQDKSGFAIFPSPEVGTQAQADLWKTKKYQGMTVLDAMKSYAPKDDPRDPKHLNNPEAYAKTVSDALDVKPDVKVSDLTDAQLKTLVQSAQGVEVQKVGTVISKAAPDAPSASPAQPVVKEKKE